MFPSLLTKNRPKKRDVIECYFRLLCCRGRDVEIIPGDIAAAFEKDVASGWNKEFLSGTLNTLSLREKAMRETGAMAKKLALQKGRDSEYRHWLQLAGMDVVRRGAHFAPLTDEEARFERQVEDDDDDNVEEVLLVEWRGGKFHLTGWHKLDNGIVRAVFPQGWIA
ncbi:hypothetical protein M409DRAFT_53765 [Zasmidium cellare ATCC 36951]|uniref:Uncharacterized protein n=1 Tax=Zasmidium cellare ATCC 36951 TaxID=1080233 RepID=A0A6A6CL80_ZASCE|nr:uncharacterized protein M409DRAFT_53765 [Zasmidium cellare ATCC 36951]KAF2167801.1 hypothetical protein M409DRAFT_53765 [Zasmidium cellare ATCC 36951]